jgi:hypothetical protein
MAALIALAGGTLAYRGAMAKVYADAERDRQDNDRKRIGLYLRLIFPIMRMKDRAEIALDHLNGKRHPRSTKGVVFVPFPEGEVAEAWNNLELFPVFAGLSLDVIRNEIASAKRLIEQVHETRIVQVQPEGLTQEDPLYHYRIRCEAIASAAGNLILMLANEIDRISEWEQKQSIIRALGPQDRDR